jgi:cold shock protein
MRQFRNCSSNAAQIRDENARSSLIARGNDSECADLLLPLALKLCNLSSFVKSTLWRSLMATGTVKWFNPTKGYGFIQPQGGGPDVFVHISAVERAGLTTLNEGQHLEYEIVSNRGKSSAENLKVK